MNTPSSAPRRSAGKKEKETQVARQARHQALADVRRELILDAARSAFFELGMEKTSIREIAHRAGYTPGAIYSYFASKEALYGALLGESLDRLNALVEHARENCAPGADCLRATARAFFEFYRENSRDLDLGFYLFQGMQPRGLTPELNETLNARLRDALQPSQDALQQLGLTATKALQEVTALFAHTVGLLVLSHTGRIRMFRQASQDLFDTYLAQLVSRAEAHSRS
ncbi:AcrR family transcriptional regulator [Massilia sp. UYP11]|uniref:TetR/AcrR family transcriptional regulator n=1 Tax=Massilia sp. UYP11 TaxID=1756385 RepID=UPI003D1A8ACA